MEASIPTEGLFGGDFLLSLNRCRVFPGRPSTLRDLKGSRREGSAPIVPGRPGSGPSAGPYFLSEIADIFRGVGAHFLAVEDVEVAETVEGLEGEAFDRDVEDLFFVAFCDALPPGQRWIEKYCLALSDRGPLGGPARPACGDDPLLGRDFLSHLPAL